MHKCAYHKANRARTGPPSRHITAAKRESDFAVPAGDNVEHKFPGIGIAAGIARFRWRAARTGGEDRQLAVSQPRVRVPVAAQAGFRSVLGKR